MPLRTRSRRYDEFDAPRDLRPHCYLGYYLLCAMRAPVFVTLYGALELVLGVTGTAQGVAHFAHLGGLAGGYLLLRHWKSRP